MIKNVRRRYRQWMPAAFIPIIALNIIVWLAWSDPPRISDFPHVLDPVWFDNKQHPPPQQCSSTTFKPFRIGCPATCVGYRPDATADDVYYQTYLAWYFGQPKAYPLKDHDVQTVYNKGINFQCPAVFVENFINASKELKLAVQQRAPHLKANDQGSMHMSLGYFCCLTLEEADWVREIMDAWILDSYPFDLSLGFDQVQCWRERTNRVTELVVADRASQVQLAIVYSDLVKRIEAKGILIDSVVPRSMQMPFHATLMGFYLCDDEEEGEDCHISSNEMQIIFNETMQVMKSIGSAWTRRGGGGGGFFRQGGRMHVTHPPRFLPKAKKHTGY